MVTRIAPSPVETAIAVGDGLPHAPDSRPRSRQPAAQPESRRAPLPPLAMPGEAFAAAVIAGQLPPRPTSVAQLRQRLGSAWQPPASPLRLMDRTA